MTQSSDSGVEAKATFALVGQEVFDLVGGDLGTVFITGALCDNDDGLSLSHVTVLSQGRKKTTRVSSIILICKAKVIVIAHHDLLAEPQSSCPPANPGLSAARE